MLINIKENKYYQAAIELVEDNEDVELYKLSVKCKPENMTVKDEAYKLELSFYVSSAGAFSVWNSNSGFNCSLGTVWDKTQIRSRAASGAPTQEILGMSGANVLNIAVSDAKTPIDIKSSVIEETAQIECKIIFFTQPMAPFTQYEAFIRLDKRKIPFYDVLKSVSCWWENDCGYKRAEVPQTARQPVYSTWYSFHQLIDTDKIIRQCELSKELGIESVIVDDGWQTDDNHRGYSYCGDWQVAEAKVKSMSKFVEGVHKAGLKFMIWFSVPWVGIHSEAYKRFAGKFLFDNGSFACFDPRYSEVREYLISIYEKAVKEWDLDGLKLDFIDEFAPEDMTVNEQMDIISLGDAVEKLLLDIKERLVKLKPDICIEFRQRYIGPVVTQCGNMLRVCDCPADPIKNRRGMCDLRMLSGNTAVHSDMMMWDLSDTAENAALQIINAIYTVPQISVMIDELPKKHYEMLKFYLKFWNEYSDILLDGEFKAYNPEANYSAASSETDTKIVAATYSGNVLSLNKVYEEIVFINGTGKVGLIIDAQTEPVQYLYTVKNCTGEVLECERISLGDNIQAFNVPPSGMITLTREV